jgi:hypothetical protein
MRAGRRNEPPGGACAPLGDLAFLGASAAGLFMKPDQQACRDSSLTLIKGTLWPWSYRDNPG